MMQRRWTPLLVSPYAWWSAARTDLITLESGNAVSSWRDVVAGIELVQATGSARPVWSPTGFNGYEVVTGDGVDDNVGNSAPGDFPAGTTPCQWWWRIDQQALAADTANKSIGGIGSTANSNVRRLERNVSSGVNRARTQDTNVSVADSAVDFSGRHVVCQTSTGTEISIEVDGGAPTTASVVSAAVATRIRLFCAPTVASPTIHCPVGIADVVVTPILTGADKSNMLAYLSRGV
jgi:hypothetical protein